MPNLEEAVFSIDLHCDKDIPRIQTGGKATIDLKGILFKAAEFFCTAKSKDFDKKLKSQIIQDILNRYDDNEYNFNFEYDYELYE